MIMTLHHPMKCLSFREPSHCFVAVLTVSVPADEGFKKSFAEYNLRGILSCMELLKAPYFQTEMMVTVLAGVVFVHFTHSTL